MLRSIAIAIAFMLLSGATGARAEDAPPKVLPAECRKMDRCIPTSEILDRSGALDDKLVQSDKTILDDKTLIRLDTVKNPITDVR